MPHRLACAGGSLASCKSGACKGRLCLVVECVRETFNQILDSSVYNARLVCCVVTIDLCDFDGCQMAGFMCCQSFRNASVLSNVVNTIMDDPLRCDSGGASTPLALCVKVLGRLPCV